MRKHFFGNVEDLIGYLYIEHKDIPHLKLQKGLYFLYAYYAPFYGENNSIETRYDLPKELFPATFEAWNYGPVIREVYETNLSDKNYFKNLSKYIIPVEEMFKTEQEKEVKMFIDDLFKQVLSTSDFSLVDKVRRDICWKKAFEKERQSIIPNEEIVKEYKTRLKR